VVTGGRLVTPQLFSARKPVPPVGLHSVKARTVKAEDFIVPGRPDRNETPVIGVKPGLILTFRESAALSVGENGIQPDLQADVLKVAVVERHGRNGNIGRGFVRGFGLKKGAIASSVGHDSHNITVIGATDADMALAVNRLIALGGGFAVAEGGQITAELALPLAGLMSLEPFETVSHRLHVLRDAAYALGCVLPEPFLQVAFLALPVIPHLKMTDRGLFDVDQFDFVD
jgi:adenine deaminase